MFLLHFVFRPDVVMWAVAILTASGFAVLQMNDFRIAKGSFLFAVIWAAGGIIMWGMNTTQPTLVRWLIVGTICAIIGILTVKASRYINRKRDEKEVTSTTPLISQPILSSPKESTAFIAENGGKINVNGGVITGFSIVAKASRGGKVSTKDALMTRGGINQFPPPSGEYRNLTNSDLRNRVKNCAINLHKAQEKYDTEMDKLLKNNPEKITKKAEEFRKYLVPATSLASEIIFRLGVLKPPPNNSYAGLSIRIGAVVLIHGRASGPSPLSDSANFLEYAAEKLPK